MAVTQRHPREARSDSTHPYCHSPSFPTSRHNAIWLSKADQVVSLKLSTQPEWAKAWTHLALAILRRGSPDVDLAHEVRMTRRWLLARPLGEIALAERSQGEPAATPGMDLQKTVREPERALGR